MYRQSSCSTLTLLFLIPVFFITIIFLSFADEKTSTTSTSATSTTTTTANADSKAVVSAPAYDTNEDCSDNEGQIKAAETAARTSCKWIEEIGSGNREDATTAFGKIFRHRFCKDNYVWVGLYIPTLTATSHQDVHPLLLHPAKPGLEKALKFHTDFGNGYYVAEQQNYAAKINPNGCWIPYLWTKPGTEQKIEKISFTMKCKDKLTGNEMMAGAGVYVPHKYLSKLNPPACKGAEKPKPY